MDGAADELDSLGDGAAGVSVSAGALSLQPISSHALTASDRVILRNISIALGRAYEKCPVPFSDARQGWRCVVRLVPRVEQLFPLASLGARASVLWALISIFTFHSARRQVKKSGDKGFVPYANRDLLSR